MPYLKSLLLLAAFMASACTQASTAPVVKVDSYAHLARFADHDGYSFTILSNPSDDETGLYTASFEFLPFSDGEFPSLVGVVFGIVKKTDHGLGWSLVNTHVGPGSFSFHATAGIYAAFVDGLNLSGAAAPYHFRIAQISPVPEPETWALMLLGLGFIVFQIRRRSGHRSIWFPLPASGRV